MMNLFTFLLRCSLFICMMLIAQGLFAVNFTLNSPSNNTVWSNPANWSPYYPGTATATTIGVGDNVTIVGFVVRINVDVTIEGTLTTNPPIIVNTDKTLTIANSGAFTQNSPSLNIEGSLNNEGTLTVNSGKVLIVKNGGTFTYSGTLNNYGTLELRSGGELVLEANPATWPGGTFDWDSGGTVAIGANGDLSMTSTLDIDSGRTLQVDGTLIIKSGNTLSNSGTININTNGDLKINQSSNLNNSGGTIDVDGSLRINSSSTYTNSGDINLGSGGLLLINSPNASWPEGTFNWNAGTVQISNNATIGLTGTQSIPSDGTLLVVGVLSLTGTLTVNGSLNNLNGELNLNPGGELVLNTVGASLPNGDFNWNGGKVTVGSGGHLTLTNSLTLGSGKTLEVKGALTNNSTFNLNSGGELILNANPAALPNGSGTFNWNSGDLTIGSNGNLTLTTPLTIPSSGKLQINNVFKIDSGGTVSIVGNGIMNLNAGELNINTTLVSLPSINWNAGKVVVNSSGNVTLNEALIIPSGRTLQVKGTLNNHHPAFKINGTLKVFNDGGKFTNSSTVTLVNSGEIIIEPGGGFGPPPGKFINNGILNVSGTISGNGTLNLNSGSTMILTGFQSWPTFNFDWKGGSTINIFSGTLTLSSSLTVESGRTLLVNIFGTLNVPTGSVLTNYGVLEINGTLVNNRTVNNNSSLVVNGTLTNNSIFDNNNSLVVNGTLDNNSNFTNNGTMSGTGTFEGAYSNTSTLAPGSSPGCFSFSNGFINDGTLEIELADGMACDDYDRVVVSGDAVVNGAINISFINGVPPSSSTFTILTATGSLSANLAPNSITWPTGYGGSWEIDGNNFNISFSMLPVELVDFRANPTDENTVSLEWQTASEQNNRGFEIQRSNDGVNWKYISFVEGAGTTLEEQYYSFIDRPNSSGMFYYRLKQMDFDGQFEFSQIRSVELETLKLELKVYPNPATSFVHINMEGDWEGEVVIRLMNTLGREISSKTYFKNIGEWNGQMDLSGLPDGIYQIVVSNGEKIAVQSIVKQ